MQVTRVVPEIPAAVIDGRPHINFGTTQPRMVGRNMLADSIRQAWQRIPEAPTIRHNLYWSHKHVDQGQSKA